MLNIGFILRLTTIHTEGGLLCKRLLNLFLLPSYLAVEHSCDSFVLYENTTSFLSHMPLKPIKHVLDANRSINTNHHDSLIEIRIVDG